MKWPWSKESKHERDVTVRLAAIEALVFTLTRQGARIMAQIDDLKASLRTATEKLDGLGQQVQTVQGGVDRVQSDFQVLLDRLNNLPPSTDLAEALELANGLSQRIGTVSAGMQALADDLASTPTPPVQG